MCWVSILPKVIIQMRNYMKCWGIFKPEEMTRAGCVHVETRRGIFYTLKVYLIEYFGISFFKLAKYYASNLI